MSFEQAMAKLENIVRTLEVGDVRLEEALKLFEEGSALSKQCLEELDRIARRLDVLKVVDGRVLRIPMDEGAAGQAAVPARSPPDDDEEE